jgi:hypothetical protein
MRYYGGWLVALGAILGLAVSIYNYFSPVSFLAPDSNIAGTPGALLVVVSTAILLVFGLILAAGPNIAALAIFVLGPVFS